MDRRHRDCRRSCSGDLMFSISPSRSMRFYSGHSHSIVPGGFEVTSRLTKPFRFIIVGSSAYLARRGRPERPDDLRQDACLRLRRSNGALALWSLNDNGRGIEIAVSGPLIANDFPTLLGAAVEGWVLRKCLSRSPRAP